MRKILFLALFLVCMNIVFAQDIANYLRAEAPGSVQFGCYNSSNGRCTSTTKCNVSVTDPDGVKVLNNFGATYTTDLFYFNITPEKVGNYQAFVYCYGSDTGFTNFLFQSNNQGKEITHFGAIMAMYGLILLFEILLLIFLLLRGSVWTYPLIIVLSITLVVFFYVWWSYSIIMSGVLYALYKVSLWLSYPTILVCLFELMANYWNWLSRRKQAKKEYGDTF